MVILSVIGTVQVMLVICGWFYALDVLSESFPQAKHLRCLGPMIGLLSLCYPVYILFAMESPKPRSLKRAKPEESPSTEPEATQ